MPSFSRWEFRLSRKRLAVIHLLFGPIRSMYWISYRSEHQTSQQCFLMWRLAGVCTKVHWDSGKYSSGCSPYSVGPSGQCLLPIHAMAQDLACCKFRLLAFPGLFFWDEGVRVLQYCMYRSKQATDNRENRRDRSTSTQPSGTVRNLQGGGLIR